MTVPSRIRSLVGVVAVSSGIGAAVLGARAVELRVVGEAAEALARGDAAGAASVLAGLGDRGLLESLLLGTALLESGEPLHALPLLETAARSGAPPALRGDALHNLAVAHLRLALTAGGAVERHAGAAAEAAREALTLRAGAPDTRWNLDLALRLLRQGRPDPSVAAASGAPASLAPAEAQRILDAVRLRESAALGGRPPLDAAASYGTRTREGPPW